MGCYKPPRLDARDHELRVKTVEAIIDLEQQHAREVFLYGGGKAFKINSVADNTITLAKELEIDSRLPPLYKKLALAKAQRNKNLMRDIEREIDNVFKNPSVRR